MPQVEANGVTLEYDMRGSGEPILFVMGLGGQLIAWPDEFVQLFVDRGYQAIRFDNRDVGLSAQTPHPPPPQSKVNRSFLTRRPLDEAHYTVADMADDAAGLLDAIDIARAHVVGMSMGGMISQELAIQHPAKVMSLCSIMSNTGDRKNGGVSAGLMAKIIRQKPPTRETAIDAAVETFGAFSGPHFDPVEYREFAEAAVARNFNPVGVAHQTAAIAAARDRTPHLRNVSAPSLVIHGLLDPLVKPSGGYATCLLYTSPSPRDATLSRMPSSA